MLNDSGGDDDGGVIRTEVLFRTAMYGSYHHADRTLIAELALHGPFYQAPEYLYFRRDHPARAERSFPGIRARCTNMDPNRADRLRNPVPRLLGEYLWALVTMIRRAPLNAEDRRECYRHLAEWVVRRARPHHLVTDDQPVAESTPDIVLADVVAGREQSLP